MICYAGFCLTTALIMQASWHLPMAEDMSDPILTQVLASKNSECVSNAYYQKCIIKERGEYLCVIVINQLPRSVCNIEVLISRALPSGFILLYRMHTNLA